MKIEVQNNVPGVKVSVNQNADGSYTILLVENENENEKENESKKLGEVKPGSVVTIGNRDYIVLDHAGETIAVITKESTRDMEFGDSEDYEKSYVRFYCNGEFYEELAKVVGKENIIQHIVKLEANDGTGKGKTCRDFISIITTENYRRYREFLKPYGNWWWTATRINSDNSDYARRVCCICFDGVLGWDGCGYSNGVRPFCILNSSVSCKITEENNEEG